MVVIFFLVFTFFSVGNVVGEVLGTINRISDGKAVGTVLGDTEGDTLGELDRDNDELIDGDSLRIVLGDIGSVLVVTLSTINDGTTLGNNG